MRAGGNDRRVLVRCDAFCLLLLPLPLSLSVARGACYNLLLVLVLMAAVSLAGRTAIDPLFAAAVREHCDRRPFDGHCRANAPVAAAVKCGRSGCASPAKSQCHCRRDSDCDRGPGTLATTLSIIIIITTHPPIILTTRWLPLLS